MKNSRQALDAWDPESCRGGRSLNTSQALFSRTVRVLGREKKKNAVIYSFTPDRDLATMTALAIAINIWSSNKQMRRVESGRR